MTAKDTRKGDRHRPGYWKEYGRIRRARDKERLAKLMAAVKAIDNTASPD